MISVSVKTDPPLWVFSLSPGLQVKSVSGEPDALVNDYNDQVGGSRDFLDKAKPIYLPGWAESLTCLKLLFF